jgi:hypothetical protein
MNKLASGFNLKTRIGNRVFAQHVIVNGWNLENQRFCCTGGLDMFLLHELNKLNCTNSTFFFVAQGDSTCRWLFAST